MALGTRDDLAVMAALIYSDDPPLPLPAGYQPEPWEADDIVTVPIEPTT